MAAALIAFLVLGVLFTLLLYVAIESETDDTEILDRKTAEEEAKRRGGSDPRKQFGKRNSRDFSRDRTANSSDDGSDRGPSNDWGNSTDRDGGWDESTRRDDDW